MSKPNRKKNQRLFRKLSVVLERLFIQSFKLILASVSRSLAHPGQMRMPDGRLFVKICSLQKSKLFKTRVVNQRVLNFL